MTALRLWWFLLTDEGNGSMTLMRLAALATGAVPVLLAWVGLRLWAGRWRI